MSDATPSIDRLRAIKQEIREQARARRRDQLDRDALSAAICRRFARLPDYQGAGTVMLYVGVRSEVGTRPLVLEAIAEGNDFADGVEREVRRAKKPWQKRG